MNKKLKILDFSHRLPGPLASKILADLGHEVIKIEDEKHRDPFVSGLFSEFDQSFEDWYQQLNQNKKILRLDFKSADIKKTIARELAGADGLILSLSAKLKLQLGLDNESLQRLDHPLAAVELEASASHKKAMHDLNALALSGHLALHVAHETRPIVEPPFFPMAGMAFGQQVATTLLSSIISARAQNQFVITTSYLYETTQSLFAPFWSLKLQAQGKTKFLHNGAYPCYGLYRLKDGNYVALAAVEDKFWINFTQLFKLSLSLEKRFDQNPATFQIVADLFAKLTTSEIETMTQDHELCLSIVRKIS